MAKSFMKLLFILAFTLAITVSFVRAGDDEEEEHEWDDKEEHEWDHKEEWDHGPSQIINNCNVNNSLSNSDAILNYLKNENKGIENRFQSYITDIAETFQKLNGTAKIANNVNSSLDLMNNLNTTLTMLNNLMGGLNYSSNIQQQQAAENSNVADVSNRANTNVDVSQTVDNSRSISQYTQCIFGCLNNVTVSQNETAILGSNDTLNVGDSGINQNEQFNLTQLNYCLNNYTINLVNSTGCSSYLDRTIQC
ncbi:hypothetical protein INT43_003784 [Umbelopsis isabellina]|uniref:Uncharacterized protein n=1 Tax=Mortierella isabellina TaxID=91625 RepID=A0A8H7PTE4_MORIS|nr:hypothetical protein INT43_003784 [Umbelopsis isabellina]